MINLICCLKISSPLSYYRPLSERVRVSECECQNSGHLLTKWMASQYIMPDWMNVGKLKSEWQVVCQCLSKYPWIHFWILNSSHAVRDLGRVRQYPPWLLFAAFVESVGCPRYNPQKTRRQWRTRDRRFHWLWGWFPDLKIIFMM